MGGRIRKQREHLDASSGLGDSGGRGPDRSGPTPTGQNEVLRRADSELKRLQRKMEAARYELQHAELAELVEQAQATGDCSELETWLAQKSDDPAGGSNTGSALAAPIEMVHQSERAASEDSRLVPQNIVAGGASSWGGEFGDGLLRAARERNAKRIDASESESGSAKPLRSSALVDAKSLEQPSETPLNQPGKVKPSKQLSSEHSPSKQLSGKSQSPKDQASNKNRASSKNQPSGKRRPSKKLLAEVKVAMEGAEETRQSSSRRRMAGAVVSALAHVLLLVVLAVVTLKLPSPAASLGFEASDVTGSESIVELAEPTDIEAPSEVTESVQQTFDASESLSDMSASLSDSLQSVSEQVSALSASTAAVSAASASPASASMKSAATFFGAAAGGNNFCYVLDVSGSMRGGPWEAAKAELLRSLASLQPSQRYFIICYSRSLDVMPDPETDEVATTAPYATPQNLEHTRRWIERLQINSAGGPPRKSLELAIEKEPDAIYLLTDGVTSVDVAAFLREVNRYTDLFGDEQVQVPIHAIAYYSDEGLTLMKQVASQNKGQFIYVPDPRG